jgi:hypothetical protein
VGRAGGNHDYRSNKRCAHCLCGNLHGKFSISVFAPRICQHGRLDFLASIHAECEENSLLQTGIVNPGAVLQRAPKRKTGTPKRAHLNSMSCGQNSQMLTSVAAMAAAATAW